MGANVFVATAHGEELIVQCQAVGNPSAGRSLSRHHIEALVFAVAFRVADAAVSVTPRGRGMIVIE